MTHDSFRSSTFVQFPWAEATYKLQVRVIRYVNFNHMYISVEEECGFSAWNYVCDNVWSDHCCDSQFASSCSLQCDNVFKFCLRSYEDVDDSDVNYCPGGSYGWSKQVIDSDDVYFANDIGGIPNPMPFFGSLWTVIYIILKLYSCALACI